MCHFLFSSVDAFMAAFMPNAPELQGDMPNYTDTTVDTNQRSAYFQIGAFTFRVHVQVGVMTPNSIVFDVGEAPETHAFLAERIYEFNAKATEYVDGESFSATHRDESDVIRAGICGYTWSGCCYVSYLWVHASVRGRGLGTALLDAAEKHATLKGCQLMFLTTHTFQAPGFYERMGYEQRARVEDHPPGHASLVFAKRLQQNP